MRQIGEIAKEKKNFNFKENLNDSTLTLKNFNKAQAVQNIAQHLVNRLDGTNNYAFFLKCAWHLSENTIWSIVESASGKRNPLHYATAALKTQLSMRGIK